MRTTCHSNPTSSVPLSAYTTVEEEINISLHLREEERYIINISTLLTVIIERGMLNKIMTWVKQHFDP